MKGKKLYYSISEVSQMFDLTFPTLRFWEKEITALKPKRNDKKTRFYTEKDIETIKQIVFLINEECLTLEGVNKRLNERKDEVARKQELYERLSRMRSRLEGVIVQIEKIEYKNQ